MIKTTRLLALLGVLLWTHFALGEDIEQKQACANRLHSHFGLKLDPSSLTLNGLIEIEARLTLCREIRKRTALVYDYRTTSLAFLRDTLAKLEACERIELAFNVILQPGHHSLSKLEEVEKRLEVASRIYRFYGRDVNWRDATLPQLLAEEQRLVASIPRLPQPNLQPLAKTAVAYSFVAPAASYSSSSFGSSYASSTSTTSDRSSLGSYYDPTYRPYVGDHYVESYMKSDGSWVRGHMRTNADDSFWNNYSSKGNVNPYTGRTGTRTPWSR